MTISLIAFLSLTGSTFFASRAAREFRRQRIESRMTRALRLAFLN